jgi:hypothetical protein
MAHATVSAFNAGSSMLGYLYQVRVALLWAIKKSREGDFMVCLETLDDVSFEANGEPAVVLQTKHSLNAAASLSDLSADLWKTLRIWMIGRQSGEIPVEAAKFLISTSTTSPGTACACLVVDTQTRDVQAAADKLKHAATTSTNADLKDAFEAFLALEQSARCEFLSNIYVIPGQPGADAIGAQLEAELYHVSLHHQALSIQMIEGWWFKRVIHELVHGGPGISRAEIDAQISDVQESLKRDSLPIDDGIDGLMIALEQLPEFSDRPFYKQVEMVGASSGRIRNAITSYLQAFRQRSAWTRNDLLFDADLDRYDRMLLSEWTLLRDQVCDELGKDPGEEDMARAGRAILKWAEDAPFAIKPGVSVPWVCRGSFHMLADDRRLGWHPDFSTRMQAIFDAQPGEASA